jgi:hypothetical protein
VRLAPLCLILFAAACTPAEPWPPDPDPYPDPGAYDGGGYPSGYCTADDQCADGQVCADTRECDAPDDLRRVSVHWTITGQPPSDAGCTPSPFVAVSLGTQAWAPVRCAAGTFTVLRVPSWDTTAQVSGQSNGVVSTIGTIPPEGGDVTVDLVFP